jgi:hypothetical protein
MVLAIRRSDYASVQNLLRKVKRSREGRGPTGEPEKSDTSREFGGNPTATLPPVMSSGSEASAGIPGRSEGVCPERGGAGRARGQP